MRVRKKKENLEREKKMNSSEIRIRIQKGTKRNNRMADVKVMTRQPSKMTHMVQTGLGTPDSAPEKETVVGDFVFGPPLTQYPSEQTTPPPTTEEGKGEGEGKKGTARMKETPRTKMTTRRKKKKKKRPLAKTRPRPRFECSPPCA